MANTPPSGPEGFIDGPYFEVLVAADGTVETVRIRGRIEPGETFSYNSYHVIKADSTATGSFFGRTDGGKPVCARIPHFDMHTPPMLA